MEGRLRALRTARNRSSSGDERELVVDVSEDFVKLIEKAQPGEVVEMAAALVSGPITASGDIEVESIYGELRIGTWRLTRALVVSHPDFPRTFRAGQRVKLLAIKSL